MLLRRCGHHSLVVHKCFEDGSKRFGSSKENLSNNPICYSDLSYHVLLEFQFVVGGYPGRVYRQGSSDFFQLEYGDAEFSSAKRGSGLFSKKTKGGEAFFLPFQGKVGGEHSFSRMRRRNGRSCFSGIPLSVQY